MDVFLEGIECTLKQYRGLVSANLKLVTLYDTDATFWATR